MTRDVVKEVDVVLTMARHHRTRAQDLGGEGKTHLLGEYVGREGAEAEVADPFGSDLDVYRETFAQLAELIPETADRLITERTDVDHRA